MKLAKSNTALCLAALGLASGCATVRPEHEATTPVARRLPPPAAPEVKLPDAYPRQGNPPFYEVLGKRYHVLPSGEGYNERGIASWYGREFHGRPTANGEAFDMHALTAAHKTLPLPSYARVTNLRNGRSVVVRINDRGPFVRNRVIDLSYAAAEALDIAREGTGIVEIEVIDPETAATDAALSGTTLVPEPEVVVPEEPPIEARELYVQVGAFGEPFNAERLRQRLVALGFDNVGVAPDVHDGRPLYRVRVGPVPDVSGYDRLVERLRAASIEDTYLTLD